MSRLTDTTGARVRLWPPALFAVPFALAALLHRRYPWPARAEGTDRRQGRLRRVAGAALIGSGAVLMGRAFSVMNRQGTTVIPWAKVEHLVADGPFARVRNPIYAADLLVYLGGTILLRSGWPLLALPGVLHLLRRQVIAPEETYLRQEFGSQYERYLQNVPRLLPRFTGQP